MLDQLIDSQRHDGISAMAAASLDDCPVVRAWRRSNGIRRDAPSAIVNQAVLNAVNCTCASHGRSGCCRSRGPRHHGATGANLTPGPRHFAW
ncbi:MAG: hypothetical protein ACREMA_14320, partial [Longimicrobiales bacterium]